MNKYFNILLYSTISFNFRKKKKVYLRYYCQVVHSQFDQIKSQILISIKLLKREVIQSLLKITL